MQCEERAVYEFGEFRLDPRRRLLTRSGGERVPLTGKAFDALLYLAERAGEPVTRTTLTDALWPSTVVEDNNLSQAISILRRALGEGLIETISRRGYQFTAEVRVVAANGPAQEQCAPQTAALAQKSSRAPPDASRLAAPRVALLGSAVAVAAVVGAVWLAQRGGVDSHADPLDGYVFSTLTEFEGVEEHAAVSRDGQFVAFLRERDGVWEVWVGQVGTGHFINLTGGTMQELRNPAVRTIGFSPDGSDVLIWTKIGHPDTGGVVDAGWAVPTLGGTPRPYRPGIAELDWSPDGERIGYHTAAAGDPLYVGDAADRNEDRLIHVAPAGLHGHFPLWSRDGRFIYFVRGVVPDEMDVWRVRAEDSQAEAERLTFHGSRVSFPTMLDDRTLLYLATANDGSGPWIHALDLDRRTSRRIDTRGQAYSSLAASADGGRLVATQVRSTTGLWRMPLSDGLDGAPVRLASLSLGHCVPASYTTAIRGWTRINSVPRLGTGQRLPLTGSSATSVGCLPG